MVCSECAVALTRINVPFAIYIVYSTVYVTTTRWLCEKQHTVTQAISTEYICKYSDQTRGMEYVFENKHTWRKHMINSGLYFVGFVWTIPMLKYSGKKYGVDDENKKYIYIYS